MTQYDYYEPYINWYEIKESCLIVDLGIHCTLAELIQCVKVGSLIPFLTDQISLLEKSRFHNS